MTSLPDHPPLVAGEIAAMGNLVWEDAQPYLETRHGRIRLLGDKDAMALLHSLDPSVGLGTVIPNQPQVLVAGRWESTTAVGPTSEPPTLFSIHVRDAGPWPSRPVPVPVPEQTMPPPQWDGGTGMVIPDNAPEPDPAPGPYPGTPRL